MNNNKKNHNFTTIKKIWIYINIKYVNNTNAMTTTIPQRADGMMQEGTTPMTSEQAIERATGEV